MKVTRIIHPVGQGGFYTETFSNGTEEKTFVYDCGGFDRAKRKMENYLKSFLPKGKSKRQIEAVFISHFHADHINGLQYLLDNAEVKNLFLPQLTEEAMIEAFVYNYSILKGKNSVNSLLVKMYNQAAGETRTWSTNFFQIEAAEDSQAPAEFNSTIFSEESMELKAWNWDSREVVDLSTQKLLSPNTMLHCGKWLYLPYNSKVPQTKIAELKAELKVTSVNMEDLLSSVEKLTPNECKRIYEKVFGKEHNSYSMTLFSGTSEHSFGEYCKRFPDCTDRRLCKILHPRRYCNNPNILYTGDFEPEKNMDQMPVFFNKYWGEIASIQIPHHGSRNNYNEKLYEHPIRGFVSVGNDNTHHHPDIDTIINIRERGCEPIIVTEDKSSMKIFLYTF